MAGTHNSGFKYATATMFHNAPMVLVPANHNDIELLSRVKELLAPAGLQPVLRHHGRAARRDDRLHLPAGPCGVQRLYQKPHGRASQGLFRRQLQGYDQVAWLAPQMWAELFLENKDFLMAELNTLIDNLRQYQDAMEHDDLPSLIQLLDDGRKRKEEVDGRDYHPCSGFPRLRRGH